MSLLHNALMLAANGLAVFPVTPRSKVPLGGNGYKDATKDKTQIEGWWAANPQANIGIATGAVAGVFVLDIDPRHGGDKTWAALAERNGGVPKTLTAKTGGGGLHLYFRHVSGLRNSVGRLGDGLDIRSDGGYVVAPPSVHESGNTYEWAAGRGLDDISAAEAPAWLLPLLQTKSQSTSTVQDWQHFITADVSEGGRNDAVAKLSGYLLGKKLPPYAALDLIQCWNAMRCKPPLDEAEVYRTVNSIAQREYEKRARQ